MENNNPIIEKIRKLLALANSCNEHEAALAASHAQRLLSEHNLAMADIESEQKPQSADKVEATVSKTLPKWVRYLSAGVCTAFDCQAIHHPALGKMTFIGVGADVQIAAYTFAYGKCSGDVSRVYGIEEKVSLSVPISAIKASPCSVSRWSFAKRPQMAIERSELLKPLWILA